MVDTIWFECDECGTKKEKKSEEEKKAYCCGKEMTELPMEVCTKAAAEAEHARFIDEDEPCDDGR